MWFIGDKCFVDGLGWGQVIELMPGRPGWSCDMYYLVRLNRFPLPHVFAAEELRNQRCGVSNPIAGRSRQV